MPLERKDVLIIGGGIAGCAAAQQLQAHGIDYLLLEKNQELGGLTRSIIIGDTIFDYTGHLLHLTQYDSPSKIPYGNLDDNDWQRINRRALVFLKGHFIPAPFQYNLYYCPEEIRQRCIGDFRSRLIIKNPKTLREYLVTGFGNSICEYFLFPYNEKLFSTELDSLGVDSVKKFFPKPEAKIIEQGYATEGANLSTGGNSTFWYPKYFGIGLLARGLARGLCHVRTNVIVEEVDIDKRLVRTRCGDFGFDKLLFSMPLKEFCERSDNEVLRKLSVNLVNTMVLCVNVLVRGTVIDDLNDAHWVYVPDKKIPFYRLGIYSNFSRYIVPPGKTSLYIEMAVNINQSPLPNPIDTFEKIFRVLEELKWVSRSQCEILCMEWIPCAYVHFNHIRQSTVDKIFRLLRESCIYPIGRYGLWDYVSMEDTIISSIETVNALIKPFGSGSRRKHLDEEYAELDFK